MEYNYAWIETRHTFNWIRVIDDFYYNLIPIYPSTALNLFLNQTPLRICASWVSLASIFSEFYCAVERMKCAIINADCRAAATEAAAASLSCSDLQLYVHTVIFFLLFSFCLLKVLAASCWWCGRSVRKLVRDWGKGGRRAAEQGEVEKEEFAGADIVNIISEAVKC